MYTTVLHVSSSVWFMVRNSYGSIQCIFFVWAKIFVFVSKIFSDFFGFFEKFFENQMENHRGDGKDKKIACGQKRCNSQFWLQITQNWSKSRRWRENFWEWKYVCFTKTKKNTLGPLSLIYPDVSMQSFFMTFCGNPNNPKFKASSELWFPVILDWTSRGTSP